MSSNRIKYLLFSAIVFLGVASSAAAETDTPIEIKFLGVNVKERATRAIEFLLSITGALALLFVIASGVFFIASTGNPDSQQKAKRILIGALTGLLIVLFSYSLVFYVDHFLV